MSDIFAHLLQEGERQKQQLRETIFPHADQKQPSPPSDEGVTARQQAVTTERQPDSTTASPQDAPLAYVEAFLQAKASQKTTLRYSPSLMAEIDDVIYQIKKTYGITLSKNEIFVLGLAHLLFDFKHNANHSLIAKALIKPSKT